MSGLHEECGVFGVFSPTASFDAAHMVYYGLYALQHRGQESCGIVVNDDGVFSSHKDIGLVNEVFTKNVLSSLPRGGMAIGHVRYATTGSADRNNCQPIEVNHKKGHMALAHNGNLVNSSELRDSLENGGAIFHTTSDTETICYIITKERLTSPSIETAVSRAMDIIDGAYSFVLMSSAKLIAARDPHGFRPLCYGKTDDGIYVVASESCALQSIGARFIRDICPGEILIFDKDGVHSDKGHCGTKTVTSCIFEYIYFARPDSVIGGVTVHESRRLAGKILAAESPAEADVVIGIPDSGLDAALGFSEASGIPYSIGFIKNKYIGRTFISPEQNERIDGLKIKLNVVKSTVYGKSIVLVDDSIVRGNTMARIIKLLRDAGAEKIHVRISSPPFLNPCYYGTDVDSRDNLIACSHSVKETAEIIGADSLGYFPAERLCELAGTKCICKACFDGVYPTDIPKDTGKHRFEKKLSDRKK